jgi:hypothetical protein
MRWSTLAKIAGLGLVFACANQTPTGPDVVSLRRTGADDPATIPESQLHFLQPDPNAPPLATLSVSFYAVPDADREAILWYHAVPGSQDSVKLARIRVPKRSVTAPTLITLSVSDPERLIIDLQPSGLVFAPNRPAKLTLWYLEADHDLNGDGVINGDDLAIEKLLGIWKQENPGDPWGSLASRLNLVGDQLETEIPGFTRYAISY